MAKRFIIFSICLWLLSTSSLYANSVNGPFLKSFDIASLRGEWKGAYIIDADVNRCAFNIFQDKGKWKAAMDAPGSNAYDIHVQLNVEGDKISFTRTIDSMNVTMVYAGTINKNVINGTYTYQWKDYKVVGVFQLMLNPSALSKFQPLPAFEVKLVDAKQVTNKSFSGKYLLIDFWSTTCKLCVPKRPALETAKELYKDKPFEILSVALDSEDEVSAFRKEKSPMLWSNAVLQEKWKDKMVTTLGVDKIGLPTTILVSPEGEILATTDQLTKDNLLKTLAKYLGDAKKAN